MAGIERDQDLRRDKRKLCQPSGLFKRNGFLSQIFGVTRPTDPFCNPEGLTEISRELRSLRRYPRNPKANQCTLEGCQNPCECAGDFVIGGNGSIECRMAFMLSPRAPNKHLPIGANLLRAIGAQPSQDPTGIE